MRGDLICDRDTKFTDQFYRLTLVAEAAEFYRMQKIRHEASETRNDIQKLAVV